MVGIVLGENVLHEYFPQQSKSLSDPRSKVGAGSCCTRNRNWICGELEKVERKRGAITRYVEGNMTSKKTELVNLP